MSNDNPMNDTTTPIHVCPTCHLAGQAIADERDACSLALTQWKPLAESLMGMIGDISNALGIDDESQETANGAGEILDALAALQAENARLVRERDEARAEAKEIRARWNDAENEFAAIKESAQAMLTARDNFGWSSDTDAAIEALRRSLTVGAGSGGEGRS